MAGRALRMKINQRLKARLGNDTLTSTNGSETKPSPSRNSEFGALPSSSPISLYSFQDDENFRERASNTSHIGAARACHPNVWPDIIHRETKCDNIAPRDIGKEIEAGNQSLDDDSRKRQRVPSSSLENSHSDDESKQHKVGKASDRQSREDLEQMRRSLCATMFKGRWHDLLPTYLRIASSNTVVLRSFFFTQVIISWGGKDSCSSDTRGRSCLSRRIKSST